jgi:ABC-type nitrate/sulfonate/bicarbonate transport system substrate-binding protein
MARVSRRGFLGGAVGAVVGAGALLAAAGCAPLTPPAVSAGGGKVAKSLTFMAGYKPQANVSFVGVYVAQELGYFAQEGLTVTIKHATGAGEHMKLLAGKQIQVTTETATDLINGVTGQGIPFVSLAVLTQTGDEALMTLKSSGITEPKQFEGKIVGYKVYPAFEYLALLKAAGVDRSKVQEVSVGFDPRILTEGKVDVLPVFKSNEPDVVRHLGFDVNLIDPAAYGVKVMGQVWATHRDLLAGDPDLYERFTRSALNGLYYAFANPKAAIDIVMKYATTEDRSHQEYMLATEQKITVTEDTQRLGIGWQTRDQWSQLQDGLAEFGLIQNKVDPATFFDDTILKKVYQNGKLVWP